MILIQDKESKINKRIANTGKKKLFLEFATCKFLVEEEMKELTTRQVDNKYCPKRK